MSDTVKRYTLFGAIIVVVAAVLGWQLFMASSDLDSSLQRSGELTEEMIGD